MGHAPLNFLEAIALHIQGLKEDSLSLPDSKADEESVSVQA